MATETLIAQADLRNTVRIEGASSAGSALVIGGERRALQDAKVVNFLDDPSWDFSKLMHPDPNSQYVVPRPGEQGPVLDLAGAQNLVDMVVIHTDITTTSRGCFNVLKSRGFSTHFMIDWDGTIYQGVDPMKMAIHAASELRGNVNKFSVGIDMNCLQMNYVQASGEVDASALADQFATPGGQRRMSEVVEINGVPWKSWGFTDAQYDALIKLLLELNVHFPKLKLAAPVDERGEIIWQVPKELDTTKMGIYGHMHLTPQKFDPGPGFDWPRLLQGLTKEHNSFPIELQKGVSIASLLTKDKVQALADLYFKNTEASEHGGYYPIGLGGQWHGGVHLHVKRGHPVQAMMDGVIVAARNGKSPTMGSNNFVLIRHEVPFDPKDDKKVFIFFSLYMHLLEFDVDKDRSGKDWKDADLEHPKYWALAPEWVSNARRGKIGGAEEEAPPEVVEDKAPKTVPGQKKDAKKKKGKDKDKKGPQRDENLPDEAPDDEDKVDPEETPFLKADKHLAALKRGDVALFAIDGSDQTRVGAGKIIGRVGNFDPDATSAEEVTSDEGVLHVEVFADGRWRQIVDLLGTHSEHWFEAEADTDDNLVADSEDLLRLILPEASSRAVGRQKDVIVTHRTIAPEDVQAFYQDATVAGEQGVLARRLRKAITRHVSEWSDRVDWVKAMVKAQAWDERAQEMTALLQDESGRGWRDTLFAKTIKRQLPYIWLTEDVAKHAGIELGEGWDALLYHFHPIHFVIWLTFHTNTRLRVLAQGRDKKELAKLRQKEQKAAEERKAAGLPPEDDDHGGEFELSALDEVGDPEDVLQPLWEVPAQPGEWRRQAGGEG
jgi:N-acetyl-anhydromuramyl-L-alanine amidase AmpD